MTIAKYEQNTTAVDMGGGSFRDENWMYVRIQYRQVIEPIAPMLLEKFESAAIISADIWQKFACLYLVVSFAGIGNFWMLSSINLGVLYVCLLAQCIWHIAIALYRQRSHDTFVCTKHSNEFTEKTAGLVVWNTILHIVFRCASISTGNSYGALLASILWAIIKPILLIVIFYKCMSVTADIVAKRCK